MKCCSENSNASVICHIASSPRTGRGPYREIRNTKKKAFSLMEVVTALAILALVCSSVLVVHNRCMASAVDSVLRMQAFEVARENMEKLLVADSVEEMTEYGWSDEYPQIKWQTTVETFSGPSVLFQSTSSGWVRAVCSAEYTNMKGREKTIELTHWLTSLTKKQMLEVAEEKRKEQEWLARQDRDKPGEQDETKTPAEQSQEQEQTEEIELPDDIDPQLRRLIEELLNQ